MHALISTWPELLGQFFFDFYFAGSLSFCSADDQLVLCTTRRTIIGMIPFADPLGRQAHDAYHRFLPDVRWDMSHFGRILARILLQTFCRTGPIVLALDDTLFHRSGRKVDGAGYRIHEMPSSCLLCVQTVLLIE